MKNKTGMYLMATGWLGLMAGFTDAYLFHITEVFPANMSGNFVILSLNLAQGNFWEGWEKIIALFSFIGGVAAASVLLKANIREIIKIDILILFKTTVLLLLATGFFYDLPYDKDWLIVWSSFVMGVQGAYAVKIGVTTNTLVLTNNIVQTVSGFTKSLFSRSAEERKSSYPVSQTIVLLVYFLGAVLSCLPSEMALLLWMIISYGWLAFYFLAYRKFILDEKD